MDGDLKIVLTSVLEADEQSSAQRISAQLPNIAKLINSNSKIRIQVALDESNTQSQAQKVSKQIQNIVTRSAIKMDVDIGSGKISEMVERLKELKVPDSAIKTFRDNIKEANISVTDIKTSFDAMSKTVTAVVTGVNKFGDTVRQTQGVKLGVNEETGELIYELNKDIVVYQQNIEKVAQTEAKRAAQDARNNESRIAYLTKQRAILSDVQASYTGATSAKPVKDTSHLDALNVAYKDLQDKINVLISSEGKLDQVQRSEIESQIARLKQLVKEYQNAEYVATKLRTKDIGSIKADQFAALDTLEKRLQSAGTLTDGFQRGIDGLRSKLQNTFDPVGLTSFLNSFDKLNNGVSVFQEKLRGANAIYAQIINIESKITKTQSLLVGLDTQVDKDKIAILKEQLSNYQLQQKALSDQLVPYASIIQYAKQAEAAERARLENELKLKYSEVELAAKAREIDETMQRIPSTIADLQTKFYQLDNPTDNLVNKMRMLCDMQSEYGNSKSESEKVAIYQRLNKLIGECNTEMTALLRIQRGGVKDVKFTAGLDKAKADLAEVARKWSALKSDPGLRTQLKQLEIDLKNVKSQTDLTKWTTQFSKFKSEIKAAGKNMLSLGDTIVNNAKKVLQWVSATTLLFRALRLLKNAVSTVVDLDTAMIDLRKVTSATNEEYRKFYLSANETAKALGVTTEAVISQTAEWARLGYSMREAAELSKNSAIFAAISPGMDITQATDGLVSVLKAFDEIDVDDSLDDIISKINDIGNKFAVSNKDIVEVMTRSSSAMKAANNTFEETVALATAAVEITRDASSVGNALKTVSMRIRGYDEEIGEYSDDIAKLTGEIADLTKVASNQNRGVSLFETGDPNTYRSTYAILADIADIWNELTDKNRAQLLEVLFGKRQGQMGSAILSNFDQAKNAIEAMENSAGSAEREMEKITQSLEYKINSLKQTWTGVAQNLFDTKLIGEMVSALQVFSNLVDGLTNSLGIFGTVGLVAAIAGFTRFRTSINSLTNDIAPVMQVLSNIRFDGSQLSVLRYAVALDKLDISQKKAVLSAMGLNKEQQKLVLTTLDAATASKTYTVAEMESHLGMTQGRLAKKLNKQATDQLTLSIIKEAMAKNMLTEKDARMLISTFKQISANELLEDSYDKLTLKQRIAAGAAAMTPMGWVTIALSILPLVIAGFTKLYDVLTVTADEARATADELHSSFNETKKDLDNLNSEFETSQSRIKELQALSDSGTITIVEQEELNKLREEIILLERRKAILEDQKKNEGEVSDAALVKAFEQQTFDSPINDYFVAEMAALIDERNKLVSEAESGWTDGTLKRFDEIEARIKELNSLVYGENFGPDIKVGFGEYVDGLLKTYKMLSKISLEDMSDSSLSLFEDVRKKLVDAASVLQTDWIDNLEVDEETKASWQGLFDAIDRCINPLGRFSTLLDSLPTDITNNLSKFAEDGELTAKQVEDLAKIFPDLKNAMDDCGVSADDVAAHFNGLSVSAGDATGALGELFSVLDTVEKMEIISKNIESVSNALGEFSEEGNVSIETLAGLSDELKNLSSFEDFVNVLSDSASSMEDVQGACNKLAEEYISSAGILDSVNDSNAHLIETILKEMGVVNAHQIVQERLNAVQLEGVLSANNLTNASWDTVEAFLKESGASETAITSLQRLRQEQYNARLAAMDLTTATTETIQALMNQASAAGVAANSISALATLKKVMDLGFEHYEKGGMTETGYQALLENARRAAQVDLSKIGTVTLPQVKVSMPKSSSKSSSKGSDSSKKSETKDVEEYIAEIDKYREAEECLRKVREESADIERRIDNESDIRKRIVLEHQMIGVYGEEQAALKNLNSERSAGIEKNVKSLRDMGFAVEYNAETNGLWISNMEHLNDLTAKSKGKYETLQEATNALRKETEELIKTTTELNDDNRDGIESWNDLSESISEMKYSVIEDLKEIVEQSSAAVDEIQNVYDTLSAAADEYAQNGGFISIDAYQDIIALGPQYMQYLIDENEQLVFNEERINQIIEAKTKQMAVEQALTYVERLRLALQEGAVENLDALLYATTEATDATFGLAYAELELMRQLGDLDENQYQAALHNIETIQSLCETAVRGIGRVAGEAATAAKEAAESAKKELESLKDELEDMQDAGDSIIEYVMDMLKHRIEQQIDLLEEMKDKYSEIIDMKKESLDVSKDEQDYQKTIAKKLREMAKLQERINALSLDDSRSAQAERAKLLDEMAELQEELSETQSDKAIESQKEALDQMEEDYHTEKDAEIKILENSISSTQKLYEMSINYIRNHWNTLYSELLEWNTEYGSSLNSEISSAWELAQAAAQRYGDFVTAIMRGISNEIDSITMQIEELNNQISSMGSSAGSIGSADKNTIVSDKVSPTQPSNENAVHSIIKRMYSNMNEHGGSGSSTSAARKAELSKENLQLGAQLSKYGINAYRSTDKEDLGTWYTDSTKKNKLFDVYRKYTYHTGGYVGNKPLKPNEQYIKVEDGELVMTSNQQNSLVDQIDRIKSMADAFKEMNLLPVSSFRGGTLSGIERNSISNITNNNRPVEINIGDTIIQGSANKETVDAHRKVTEDMVNEFARLTGVKW